MTGLQASFASCADFTVFRKKTKRSKTLELLARAIPWDDLCALVAEFYPKDNGIGRPPKNLAMMMRIFVFQTMHNLSDPKAEQMLNSDRDFEEFVGLDLGREPAPDETTICRFRLLLQKNNFGEHVLQVINKHLVNNGLEIKNDTIVDSTIIVAPSSTKNKARKRDPEMASTRKGNNWYFGGKGHIGVDAYSKIIVKALFTAANVHDRTMINELLRGMESRVFGDKAYAFLKKTISELSPGAEDCTHERGTRGHPLSAEAKERNRIRSKVRARVEHCFHPIKCVFGFRKVRYRGRRKNGMTFATLCALANIFMMRNKLSFA